MSSFRALNVLSALNVLNVSNVPITVSLSHLLEQCDYESPYEKALGSNVLAFFLPVYTPSVIRFKALGKNCAFNFLTLLTEQVN